MRKLWQITIDDYLEVVFLLTMRTTRKREL